MITGETGLAVVGEVLFYLSESRLKDHPRETHLGTGTIVSPTASVYGGKSGATPVRSDTTFRIIPSIRWLLCLWLLRNVYNARDSARYQCILP